MGLSCWTLRTSKCWANRVSVCTYGEYTFFPKKKTICSHYCHFRSDNTQARIHRDLISRTIIYSPFFLSFFFLPPLCPGEIGHTNDWIHNGLFENSSGHLYLQRSKWLIAAQWKAEPAISQFDGVREGHMGKLRVGGGLFIKPQLDCSELGGTFLSLNS